MWKEAGEEEPRSGFRKRKEELVAFPCSAHPASDPQLTPDHTPVSGALGVQHARSTLRRPLVIFCFLFPGAHLYMTCGGGASQRPQLIGPLTFRAGGGRGLSDRFVRGEGAGTGPRAVMYVLHNT